MFIHSLEVPYTNKKIFFREINTDEQISLAKTCLNNTPNVEYFLDFHNTILDTFSKTLKDASVLKEIDIIEYLLLVIKARIISIGNVLELYIQKEDQKAKITINLNDVLKRIVSASCAMLDNKIIDLPQNKIKICLQWPKLNSVDLFHKLLTTNANDFEKITSIIPEFVNYIQIKNKTIFFNLLNENNKQLTFNKLPTSLTSMIQNCVFDLLRHLSEIELFEMPSIFDVRFNFFTMTYLEVIKLLFTTNIKSIYEEIFILSRSNFQQEYCLNISPIERKIYLGMIKESEAPQIKDNFDDISVNDSGFKN
jgi:hypothetical protein